MNTEAQNRALPAQPSLEHLRKEAKQQLAVLRSRAASVQLADAQLVVARSYGFSSWRTMKDEVDRRREALGLPPPAILLGDAFHRPRQPADRTLVQDSVDAEHTFCLMVTFPFLAAPAHIVSLLVFFLLG